MKRLDAELEKVYRNKLIDNYRYGALGIHKNLKGQGIGRYVHERMIEEVSLHEDRI